ncbi:MAG: protein-disulfide reductase DsbD N-terminal domain-containing protein [Micropepsaceae bacterium]
MKWPVLSLALVALAPAAHAGCHGECARKDSAAVATQWSGDAKAPTRLILSSSSHGHGGPVWIAVEMQIADGWFVYADTRREQAGPQLEWSGSSNLAAPVLRWPPPEWITLDGKEVAVYRGHAVLPVAVSPLQPEGDIRIGLRLSYAVCGEVCRPGYAVHTISLSAAPAPVTAAAAEQAARIAAALALAEESRAEKGRHSGE